MRKFPNSDFFNDAFNSKNKSFRKINVPARVTFKKRIQLFLFPIYFQTICFFLHCTRKGPKFCDIYDKLITPRQAFFDFPDILFDGKFNRHFRFNASSILYSQTNIFFSENIHLFYVQKRKILQANHHSYANIFTYSNFYLRYILMENKREIKVIDRDENFFQPVPILKNDVIIF